MFTDVALEASWSQTVVVIQQGVRDRLRSWCDPHYQKGLLLLECQVWRYVEEQQGPLSAELPGAWVLMALLRLVLPLFQIGAGCLLPGPCWLSPVLDCVLRMLGRNLVSHSFSPLLCSFITVSLYSRSSQSQPLSS